MLGALKYRGCWVDAKRRGYGLRIQAAGLRASRKKIRRRTTDFFDFAKAKASAFGIGVSFAT